jgi:membrane protein implicated in regulation of membrane protease activity
VDAWVWWLIATVLLVIGEMVTTSLVLGMIAVGSAAAGIVSAAGGGGALQIGAFAVVSLGMLIVARPVAIRHLRTPTSIRTGVAALVGAEAEVLSEVGSKDGRIKLAGEIWSARAYDGETEYATGSLVRVVEISGATALVA